MVKKGHVCGTIFLSQETLKEIMAANLMKGYGLK